MPRRRSKERSWSHDPERVLSGELDLTLRELLRLIQDVNPTRRVKDTAVAQARYVLKSRLQSLLLERHAQELSVVRTVRPGIVGLRHPAFREDGGHARLDKLSVRARELALARLVTLERRFHDAQQVRGGPLQLGEDVGSPSAEAEEISGPER